MTGIKNKSFGPYSPIVQAGNHYYISGQVGVDPATKKASSNIDDQTKQVMKNLEAVLESRNLSLSNLVKTTIYLKNIADFDAVNKIYESFFDQNSPRPSRACVEVSSLPNVADKELLIEIEAVAYKE
ncbi:MAG TPA: RidA family protein [Candidatus Saccharimonadales bacterium]|nr:RidA family protein [Candidatus Saccharimonadales bacterium]